MRERDRQTETEIGSTTRVFCECMYVSVCVLVCVCVCVGPLPGLVHSWDGYDIRGADCVWNAVTANLLKSGALLDVQCVWSTTATKNNNKKEELRRRVMCVMQCSGGFIVENSNAIRDW